MGIIRNLQNLGLSMRAAGSTFRLFPTIPPRSFANSRLSSEKSVQTYRVRSENGWAQDAANLRSDWIKVGESLRIAVRKYAQNGRI